jgi:hypothetical protein
MRENQDARHITLDVLTCLPIVYSNFVKKRIPDKDKIYEQWHKDFTIKFTIEDKWPAAKSGLAL